MSSATTANKKNNVTVKRKDSCNNNGLYDEMGRILITRIIKRALWEAGNSCSWYITKICNE